MNNEPIKDDIVLNDDELVCILTETRKKATPKAPEANVKNIKSGCTASTLANKSCCNFPISFK